MYLCGTVRLPCPWPGVYFWSCALCSWGILVHPLAILLADFMVIADTRVSIPLIYVTWWIMTMAFSVVMWSRLHLIMPNTRHLRWVLYMIIFTTVCISIPSMVIGPMSVSTSLKCVYGPAC
jgi:hypothetical protein